MVKKWSDNKLKLRIFLGLIIIGVMGLVGLYDNTLTGQPIVTIPEKSESGCTFSNTTYGGDYFEILGPKNNSYINFNNLTFSVRTDFYGGEIIQNCLEEISLCPMSITFVMRLPNNTIIHYGAVNTSKTNEGNKTYTFPNECTSNVCKEGNYTIDYKVEYTCETLEILKATSIFGIHNEAPIITEIYPTNNLIINISTNATKTIFYKLNATDTLGILSKTTSNGTNIVDMIQNPNYNETLSPGTYIRNFTAIDLAGNIDNIVVLFSIVNSSTNTTIQTNTTNQTNVTTNTTFYFDQTTTEDNKITNISSLHIKLIANTTAETTTLTFKIYDSTGIVVYQNSTSQQILEVSHTFISDGIYFYNATFASIEETKTTPTRKIIIDTEAPEITISSPKSEKENFTNSVLIDFASEDPNGISKQWINDGVTNINYAGKMSKNLSEGEYTWTLFSQDNAGNTAKKIIKFSIIEDKSTSSTKTIAIVLLIAALILAIILIVVYFLRKTPSETPATQNQPTRMPPTNPPMQFNRPMPPRPSVPQNPAMFKNNPYQA